MVYMEADLSGKYNFKEFDPLVDVRDCSTIIVAGSRRSSKSFCIRDLLYKLKQRVYDLFVFSGTYDFEDHPWGKMTPADHVNYVAPMFPDDKLNDVLSHQAARMALTKDEHLPCPPSVVVLENLDFLRNGMSNNQAIKELCYNGRHKRCFTVVETQNITAVNPDMADYVVLTACFDPAVRKYIFEKYASRVFRTLQEFEAAFDQITAKDHGVMVIDCKCMLLRPDEVVFCYKAEEHGDFHVGAESVWGIAGSGLDDDKFLEWIRKH